MCKRCTASGAKSREKSGARPVASSPEEDGRSRRPRPGRTGTSGATGPRAAVSEHNPHYTTFHGGARPVESGRCPTSGRPCPHEPGSWRTVAPARGPARILLTRAPFDRRTRDAVRRVCLETCAVGDVTKASFDTVCEASFRVPGAAHRPPLARRLLGHYCDLPNSPLRSLISLWRSRAVPVRCAPERVQIPILWQSSFGGWGRSNSPVSSRRSWPNAGLHRVCWLSVAHQAA